MKCLVDLHLPHFFLRERDGGVIYANDFSVVVNAGDSSGIFSIGGEVEIPYPFGIGSNCSLGEWFTIDCNHSTTPPKPFLSKIQSEVTSISYGGRISINWPIVSSSNCSNGSNKTKSADLTGSSFVFSEADNKFIAVGCNNTALITSNTTTIYGGCLSLCNNETLDDREFFTCNGIDCCQTNIPADLKLFHINLLRLLVEKEEKDCNYGFVVDQYWFFDNIRLLSDLKNWEFLPAVLDWSIPRPMFDLMEVTEGETISRECGSAFVNSTSFGDHSSVVICNCKHGYQGNPYLSSGCQDIDECVVSRQSPCPSHMICKNTNGNYSCIDKTGPIDPRPQMQPIGVAVGLAAGVCILIFGSLWLNKVVKRRKKVKRKEKFFKRNGGLLLKQQLGRGEVNVEKTKLFDSKELEKATDRFNANRVLGQGGQGTVYKGMLTDGKIVAVKKSKIVDESKIEEFINEVVILSQINHRNIVKLMGCCLETEVPLLVYEFVPNGTLFNFLHESNEELPLTWEMRMRIANEIAGALFYLHSAASQPIFHRDIKSSNILLDEKYRAKIADFGTSRSVAIDQTHLTTQVQGTFGYLDPEFFQSNQFTEKSDVYSFGVVLVELLTGQAPISHDRLVEGRNLAFYFIDSMEGNTLFDILDGRVIEEGSREDIIVVAKLAKRCLNLNGRVRPTMKEVVMELGSLQRTQKDEIICSVDEVARREEIMHWEDTSTSTRSYLDNDTLTLLDQ